MTPRRALSAILAVGALLLNFAIERFLAIARPPLVLIPGFLDYAPTLNRGVSFGLLRQDGNNGRLVLIAVLAMVSAFVTFLAWRSANRLQAAGYGLVVGGALGNLADRVRGGAVFDYLFLHLGGLPLFVFNFSDAAISAGALILAADAFLSAKTPVPDS
ncbi:MAG TPA: signal peptidase II [Rhizomicrobium sp.]|nr:signal peptidase II [Rhizomicrobium sp.]